MSLRSTVLVLGAVGTDYWANVSDFAVLGANHGHKTQFELPTASEPKVVQTSTTGNQRGAPLHWRGWVPRHRTAAPRTAAAVA